MTAMTEAQRRVGEFVREHDLEAPVQARLLDLASEVGELSKEVLEGTGYGRRDFRNAEGWEGELGDALFSLLCLANSTGVDLDDALTRTLEKYRERLVREDDAGSGR